MHTGSLQCGDYDVLIRCIRQFTDNGVALAACADLLLASLDKERIMWGIVEWTSDGFNVIQARRDTRVRLGGGTIIVAGASL